MARFQETLDERVFQEIVERHYASALAIAQSRVRDYGIAQDAVQETFVRVVRDRRRYDPDRAFSPWFYTILRNICTDLLRKQIRYGDRLRVLEGDSLNRSVVPEVGGVYEALAKLPEGDRDVLVLRLLRDLSFEEISVTMDCSLAAVKKRCQRAMNRLRDVLGREESKGDPEKA